MELTARQQQLFSYLRQRLEGEGRVPSLRQAAADLGVSHTAVAQLMQQLEKKGMVARQGRYGRSIRLLPGGGEPMPCRTGREVPLVGRIAAGLPMYAQQEWQETIVVDPLMFPGDNLFALRVKGQSMRDAGILDGDVVLCEPRQYAENGEIVVALVKNEEATVKRFFLYSDHIELRPANEAYEVMCYPFGEVLVQGKVVGVLRGRHAEFDGKRL
jgi:repressor LexA